MLSLPLEYSIITNYWLVQAVKYHLRLREKTIKLAQLQDDNSCVLYSVRVAHLPQKQPVLPE